MCCSRLLSDEPNNEPNDPNLLSNNSGDIGQSMDRHSTEKDNTTSFDQTWSVYKNGFGQITSNFWLGLEKIYQLTMSGQNTMLRLEVLVVNGRWYSAEYSSFNLESEAGNYSLHVNGNWGDMGDVFNLGPSTDRQNGMAFTTKDADHDLYGPANCAILKNGGFWYNACYHISLNGIQYCT